jgi:DNA-binding Lrp family transcriptional regulator
VLDKETTEKLYDFLKDEPKTVQEISHLLGKSWLTAQRYVEKLLDEGVIGSRTFRGGTRGALKIVFLRPKLQSLNATQEYIHARILSGSQKSHMSPSEIFQFAKQKEAFSVPAIDSKQNFVNMKKHFLSAQNEVLSFSGNLSFLNISHNGESILDVFKTLAQRGVTIKVLCRVEVAGLENIQKLLAINKQIGKTMIFIRHAYCPLRADIIDGRMISCAETLEKSGFREKELAQNMTIIYKIYDSDWVTFLNKIFWEYYSGAIDAQDRITLFSQIVNSGKFP